MNFRTAYMTKRAALAAAAVGGAGAMMGLLSLGAFGWHLPYPLSPLTFVLGAGAGAALAGWATAPLWGRTGVSGYLVSLLGFLLATLLGANLAGVAMYGANGVELALAWLFFSALSPLGLAWLLLWGCVQAFASRLA